MPAGAAEPVYAKYREKMAPDTTACIFWLKNRRKDEWRDKLDHEHSGKVDLSPTLIYANAPGQPRKDDGR
jgi:hypothetical protein